MRTSFTRCFAALTVFAALSVASTVFADPPGGAISGVARAPARGATVHTIVYRGGEQADFQPPAGAGLGHRDRPAHWRSVLAASELQCL